ncbi:MAG: 2-oxo acid dehydrogenase subunit E2 [Clostridium sp.]|jgi:pyruvate dehydrogenase E2 component (dihydrolipoamide acetyltransferase)|nr:2-oxo acid dehydrogenase subunit E2 [Clostridium sp.]
MKFEYVFPDIGEGIHEGVLFEWLVEEGDLIKEGQSVAEVETDKVTTEIPSARTGKVLELKFKKGDTIHVGDVFIVIDTEGGSSAGSDSTSKSDSKSEESKQGDRDLKDQMKEENLADSKEPKKDDLDEKEEVLEEETAGVVGEVIASSREIPPSTEGQETKTKTSEKKKVLATPVARHMAKDMGVDITSIEGSGPNGRVMKEDIKKASESQEKAKPEKSTPAKQIGAPEITRDISEEKVERIPLTKIRQTIATKMAESRFTIPHTTAMDEIDVTALDAFRKKYKEVLKEEGVSLTFLPFIIKAVIIALKQYPEFNSELDEENQELILKHFYNIGVATDTDRGLMVPVVKDADRMSIVELAQAIEDVTGRAKENEVKLEELRGSTFSVTNYGSIGGHFGIPIINYPEAGILGLGRIVKKPVVEGDEIVIRKVLPLSLSYDHRTIDGASGARFLNTLKDLLTNPEMLMLKS